MTILEILERDNKYVLDSIISNMRVRGEWAMHGLYARIGAKTGFSNAYIGRVLNGKNPIRENFLLKISEYLNVPVESLLPEQKTSNRGRGSGKTPQRVVDLLKEEVERTSILHVSKETGLGLAAIGRYLKGVGEPTVASLQKLANYFNETFIIEVKPEQNQSSSNS